MERGRMLGWLVVMIACLATGYHVFSKGIGMQPDSSRYAEMGANLLVHGTLSGEPFNPSVAPKPGLGSGGLVTAAELALAGLLHDGTAQALTCLAQAPQSTTCGSLTSLKVLYTLELSVFFICLYGLARRVFGDVLRPCLAVGFALAFRDIRNYDHDMLTEPAYLMFLGLFLLVWLDAVRQDGRWQRWLVVGCLIGLLAMVKPAWTALVPGLAVISAALVVWQWPRRGAVMRCYAALVVGWGLIQAPLLLRNGLTLGYWGLSDTFYLVTNLSHRFAYNAMPWRDFFAGFLYYMPDFGDRAAEALFGVDTGLRLSWDPEGYYAYGRDVLHRIALSQGSLADARAYLLREHFFNDPVKSAAVTLLLTWRGLFVGHLFGLVALVLMLPVLWASARSIRISLLVLVLPILMMAVGHALISVNIPRYNLGLIVIYSCVLAQLIYGFGVGGRRLLVRATSPAEAGRPS